MRYFVRTFVGLGLIAFGCTVTAYAVYQLLQIGTCASGNTPYVIARECPPGTERTMIAIFPAIVLALIGTGVYATRGAAPGAEGPARGTGLAFLWAGLFLGIAFACFWGVWGPDANVGPDAKLGGLIVGFLFVPMGIGGGLLMASVARAGGKDSGAPIAEMLSLGRAIGGAESQAAKPVAPAGGDAVSKLERLDRLRKEGAVSDSEFERLKQDIIGSG